MSLLLLLLFSPFQLLASDVSLIVLRNRQLRHFESFQAISSHFDRDICEIRRYNTHTQRACNGSVPIQLSVAAKSTVKNNELTMMSCKLQLYFHSVAVDLVRKLKYI